MKDLLPYLVGAAFAFAVQFLIQIYVVPHVETARRHRERWEKDVLDLGALLTTTISDLAERALSAQLYVRRMATLTGPDFDQAKVEVELGKQQVAAREATRPSTVKSTSDLTGSWTGSARTARATR